MAHKQYSGQLGKHYMLITAFLEFASAFIWFLLEVPNQFS